MQANYIGPKIDTAYHLLQVGQIPRIKIFKKKKSVYGKNIAKNAISQVLMTSIQ